MATIERRKFLYALGASGFAPALLGISDSEAPAAEPLDRALVLSGGGARGAYEAGLVGALAAAGAVSDGTPLHPYEIVCGTSIGALNAWFVATAQYSKLHDLWYGISGEQLMRLKPEYQALRDSQSGLANRAASVVSLAGLARNQTGVLQSKPVYDWIVRNLDPTTPLAMVMVWAVTNLTLQRPEYFFLRPGGTGPDVPERVVHALQLSLGARTVVREATPDLLHRAIFASAALPIAFDPVLMPGPDGTVNEYCDGGVASNSPVGIAHAVSKAADVVLLDPPFEPDVEIRDAIEIAFSVFGTMQRKILETEMHNVYFQSLARRAISRLTKDEFARAAEGNELLARFVHTLPVTDLRYIRPEAILPVSVAGFGDEEGIGKAYRAGWLDVARGFTPYDWSTFEL
ncbi:MAG TPA: patatin-like phospholipase family protein [Candidatus Cybelea sp.]|nr:patatin-like phospholipase family protein [Candidatus Cybelea sp.]